MEDLSTHTRYCHMATILSHYMQGTNGGEDTWAPFLVVPVPDPAESRSVNTISTVRHCMAQVFTNVEGREEEIYPLLSMRSHKNSAWIVHWGNSLNLTLRLIIKKGSFP